MFLVAKLQNIHFPRYWKIRINKCLKSYFCIPTYIQNVDSYVCEDSLQRHQAVPVLLQGRGGQVVLQRDQPGEGEQEVSSWSQEGQCPCDLWPVIRGLEVATELAQPRQRGGGVTAAVRLRDLADEGGEDPEQVRGEALGSSSQLCSYHYHRH